MIKCLGVACQYGTNSGLIEHSYAGIKAVESLKDRFIPVVDCTIIAKCAATSVAPVTSDGCHRQCGVHVSGAITLSGKSVTQTKKGPRGGADHRGQSLNLFGRDATDGFSPGGIT